MWTTRPRKIRNLILLCKYLIILQYMSDLHKFDSQLLSTKILKEVYQLILYKSDVPAICCVLCKRLQLRSLSFDICLTIHASVPNMDAWSVYMDVSLCPVKSMRCNDGTILNLTIKWLILTIIIICSIQSIVYSCTINIRRVIHWVVSICCTSVSW